MNYIIPFNKPSITGKELEYIKQAVKTGKISGDGYFSNKCGEFLMKKFRIQKALLTPSASSALDMIAMLIRIKPGDEVIIPSFTFTSTANSFVIFGAKPVFIDIRSDTLNIDENKIEERISSKTKAICCMHYAGVACEMDNIMKIARKYHLPVIEDAAQCINAKYKDKFLGTIGEMGAYSFHETKNVNCGEGGALLINRKSYIKRAEIIREKGTDRAAFFRGETDKYTWRDIGSSFLLSEICAAYLFAQLENIRRISLLRKMIYDYYSDSFKMLEKQGKLKLPVIPAYCRSNHHIFYLKLDTSRTRDKVMEKLRNKGILTVYHYLPLHLSPMGKGFGYHKGDFPVTEDASGVLLRLPLYNTLTIEDADFVVKSIKSLL